uniref:Uncharacterized protein n=1 Tax=Noctiluca scintillans TaxID=2966 RepID=A0A7S1FFU5_NOCSC|mmetsp:Transcript_61037/g.162047  ORF Transcript_61037/g.162047 Transcript_61037/m.162047 type:complete len:754 (+) Transcript_61037:150-2411(+)
MAPMQHFEEEGPFCEPRPDGGAPPRFRRDRGLLSEVASNSGHSIPENGGDMVESDPYLSDESSSFADMPAESRHELVRFGCRLQEAEDRIANLLSSSRECEDRNAKRFDEVEAAFATLERAARNRFECEALDWDDNDQRDKDVFMATLREHSARLNKTEDSIASLKAAVLPALKHVFYRDQGEEDVVCRMKDVVARLEAAEARIAAISELSASQWERSTKLTQTVDLLGHEISSKLQLEVQPSQLPELMQRVAAAERDAEETRSRTSAMEASLSQLIFVPNAGKPCTPSPQCREPALSCYPTTPDAPRRDLVSDDTLRSFVPSGQRAGSAGVPIDYSSSLDTPAVPSSRLSLKRPGSATGPSTDAGSEKVSQLGVALSVTGNLGSTMPRVGLDTLPQEPMDKVVTVSQECPTRGVSGNVELSLQRLGSAIVSDSAAPERGDASQDANRCLLAGSAGASAHRAGSALVPASSLVGAPQPLSDRLGSAILPSTCCSPRPVEGEEFAKHCLPGGSISGFARRAGSVLVPASPAYGVLHSFMDRAGSAILPSASPCTGDGEEFANRSLPGGSAGGAGAGAHRAGSVLLPASPAHSMLHPFIDRVGSAILPSTAPCVLEGEEFANRSLLIASASSSVHRAGSVLVPASPSQGALQSLTDRAGPVNLPSTCCSPRLVEGWGIRHGAVSSPRREEVGSSPDLHRAHGQRGHPELSQRFVCASAQNLGSARLPAQVASPVPGLHPVSSLQPRRVFQTVHRH